MMPAGKGLSDLIEKWGGAGRMSATSRRRTPTTPAHRHAAPPPRALPGGGEPRRHVLVAIVINKPGVLNRVASLMRARNFNIESLAVSHTDSTDISRMTITLHGDDVAVEQAAEAALPADRRAQGPGRDAPSRPSSTSSRWSRSARPTRTGRRSSSSSSCTRAGSSTSADGSVIVEATGTEARGRRVRRAAPRLRHQGAGPHREPS